MKKKFMMLSCIAAVAIATVVGKKTYESHAYETNSLLMQNVEALTNNESEGQSECKGLLGICNFNCKDCGYNYWAVGSTFINNHKCSQK